MKKILIIEDEPDMNEQAINKISTNYFCLVADCIEAAILRLYESPEHFDLIILDVMMNAGPYDYDKTVKGTETGWVFYEDKLKYLNIPIILWTRNSKIFEKKWGMNVKTKVRKGNKELLLTAINKELQE